MFLMTDKSNWYQFSEAALTFFVACLDRWNLWKQLDLHCDWQLQLLRLQWYRTEWWLGSKEISQNQSSQQITQTPSVTISWIFFPLFPQLFFSFSSFKQSLFLPPLCLRLPVQLKPYFLRGIFKFLSPCIGGTNPGIGGTAAVVTLQGSLNKQIILNTGLTRFCNNTQNKLLSYQCGCFPISLHCINYVHRHNPPSAQSLTGHLFASFMWWDGIEALMPSSCSWRFSKDIMLWAHPSIRQSKCIPLYGNTICEIPKC